MLDINAWPAFEDVSAGTGTRYNDLDDALAALAASGFDTAVSP